MTYINIDYINKDYITYKHDTRKQQICTAHIYQYIPYQYIYLSNKHICVLTALHICISHYGCTHQTPTSQKSCYREQRFWYFYRNSSSKGMLGHA